MSPCNERNSNTHCDSDRKSRPRNSASQQPRVNTTSQHSDWPPSELLQRRPDIAAAERRVAEAKQQIGIARAAYFPTVTLGGNRRIRRVAGFKLVRLASGLLGRRPAIAQTLFDAGRRRATSDSARGNYDAAVATYRQTSLTAFQEVEDNVAALRILENETQQQEEAVASIPRLTSNFLQIVTKAAWTRTSRSSPRDDRTHERAKRH